MSRSGRVTTTLRGLQVALAMVVALVLLGAALSACGGASGSASTTASAPAGAVLTDLAYGADSPAQKLDLYLPEQGEAPYPVLLAIHGGGFLSGDKADGQIAPVLEALKRGYAVAGLNYRLSDEATFPAAISDVKAAIRWLRAHAADYGLDPERFAAWGQSAGGTLAALAGTSGGVTALAGPDPQNADQSDTLQAVVDWYGPISFLRTDEDFRAAGFAGTDAEGGQSFLSQYMGAPLRRDPRPGQGRRPHHLRHAGRSADAGRARHGGRHGPGGAVPAVRRRPDPGAGSGRGDAADLPWAPATWTRCSSSRSTSTACSTGWTRSCSRRGRPGRPHLIVSVALPTLLCALPAASAAYTLSVYLPTGSVALQEKVFFTFVAHTGGLNVFFSFLPW